MRYHCLATSSIISSSAAVARLPCCLGLVVYVSFRSFALRVGDVHRRQMVERTDRALRALWALRAWAGTARRPRAPHAALQRDGDRTHARPPGFCILGRCAETHRFALPLLCCCVREWAADNLVVGSGQATGRVFYIFLPYMLVIG